MFYWWYKFTRLFYYPLINWIVPLFSKKVRDRICFEAKNFKDPASISFLKTNEKADFAFEFASEGELEQVRPLIMKVLSNGRKVELLFSSESVEHQCEKIYKIYPKQVRYLRLYLLKYNPLSKSTSLSHWVSSHKLFMCRYDFYPELIQFGSQKNIEFALLWASTKSFQKVKSKFLLKRFYENTFHSFDKLVAATPLDHAQFIHDLNIKQDQLEVYDFRPVQILKRIESSHSILPIRFNQLDAFKTFLNQVTLEKRIIYGSFWLDEVKLFKSYDGSEFRHVIVPHKLEQAHAMANELNQLPWVKALVVDENTTEDLTQYNTLILNYKGILCELYPYFSHAYVGNGFGESVHSLMEPFLANCFVICGPKVHRSTEYDLISQSHPDHLHIIHQMEEFSKCISHPKNEISSLNSFIQHYKGHYTATLMWLGIEAEEVW
tara:strand:- start:1391 stop:2695 length:1305 start_codon:yes stop_codon:yes gene_type:complete